MRKNRGITLIALIITIIVMLILVAVSVNILIKSNLIGTAEKAANKYKTASEEEANGGKITIDGKVYESIDDYLEGKKEKPKVGDYISNYEPTPVYNNDTNYKVEGSLSGTEEDQTFTKDEILGWRVLSIDEATGKIELIADTATSEELQLGGAIGWNNSINIINDTCKAIYSKAGVGEARSINVEDVNKISGYDPTTYEGWGSIEPGYGSTYPKELINAKFPLEYLKEKGIKESTFTEEEKRNGKAENSTIEVTNTYYKYKPESRVGYTAPTGLINIGTTYWLASRCVSLEAGEIYFDVRYVYSNGNVSGINTSDFRGNTNRIDYALRPVVSLESSVQLEKDEETTTAEKTYWKIK